MWKQDYSVTVYTVINSLIFPLYLGLMIRTLWILVIVIVLTLQGFYSICPSLAIDSYLLYYTALYSVQYKTYCRYNKVWPECHYPLCNSSAYSTQKEFREARVHKKFNFSTFFKWSKLIFTKKRDSRIIVNHKRKFFSRRLIVHILYLLTLFLVVVREIL